MHKYSGHITDSIFYGHSYSTERSREIFGDLKRMQRFLDVEAVLAQAQGELGIIPQEAAAAITRAADITQMDTEIISREIRETGHSLVALIRALSRNCGNNYGEFVHYGATTQDIQDTAQSMEMREVLAIIDEQLGELLKLLAAWAKKYKSSIMPGRTHGRPAMPITFGFKVAVWIDELLRIQERITQMKSRVLVAQLYGAVGSMAGFGDKAFALLEKFAVKLHLDIPAIAWHVNRDRVTEYVMNLSMLAASLAKIADEIRTLERPEFGELQRRWKYGKVSSSTMPHKRNPEKAQQIVVLAKLAKAQVTPAIEAMHNEHERDSRGLRLEWAVVADVSHYTLSALEKAKEVISQTEVLADKMEAGTHELLDVLCTEAIMLKLGEKTGKETAYKLLYDISQQAQNDGVSIRQCVAENKEVRRHLDKEAVHTAFDPNLYLGKCEELVENVLKHYEKRYGAA